MQHIHTHRVVMKTSLAGFDVTAAVLCSGA